MNDDRTPKEYTGSINDGFKLINSNLLQNKGMPASRMIRARADPCQSQQPYNQTFFEEDNAARQKMALINFLSSRQITPLPTSETVDADFPSALLPTNARKWIRDLSSAFDVHPGISGTLLLALLSIAFRGKFKVQRHANHVELVTLYVLIIMPSGRMKTPLMDAALAPIRTFEKELQSSHFQEKEKHQAESRVKRQRLRNLEKKAAMTKENQELLEEIIQLQRSIQADPVIPVLLTNTFTPEGLEKEAAKQGGTIAVASSELGAFKKLNAKKNDFLLHGWDEETFVNTKSKDSLRIEYPRVSVLLATQERNAAKFLSNEDFQEDGLLGRFLTLTPPEMTRTFGYASTGEVPESSRDWQETIVRDILETTDSKDASVILHFEDQALRYWHPFESHTKQEAEREEYPIALRSFYRKLAGTALRFAGIVHVLDCHESGKDFNSPIQKRSVEAGIQIANFYAQHAKKSLDVQRNNNLDMARLIVEYLKENRQLEVTVREINRSRNKLRGDVEKLHAPLKMLEEHGYIALFRQGKSRICLVNPNLSQI